MKSILPRYRIPAVGVVFREVGGGGGGAVQESDVSEIEGSLQCGVSNYDL